MNSLQYIVCAGFFVLSGCVHSAGPYGETSSAQQAQVENHREQGRQAFNRGNFSEAAQHLEQARELETQPSETNTLLGLTYSAMNRHQDAVNVLGEGPHLPTAEHAFALGSALVGVGRTQDAVAWLKEAVRMDPQLATLYQVSDGTVNPRAAVNYYHQRTHLQQTQEEILGTILQDTKDQIRQEIREQIAEDLILGR